MTTRMGRPALPKAKKRSERILTYVTPPEYRAVKARPDDLAIRPRYPAGSLPSCQRSTPTPTCGRAREAPVVVGYLRDGCGTASSPGTVRVHTVMAVSYRPRSSRSRLTARDRRAHSLRMTATTSSFSDTMSVGPLS